MIKETCKFTNLVMEYPEISFSDLLKERREVCYLTVFAVTREYGGHEEGGWWYDDYCPLESIAMPISLREKYTGKFVEDIWEEPELNIEDLEQYKILMRKYEDDIYGDIYSSTGGQDIYIRFTDKPLPYEGRPYYS